MAVRRKRGAKSKPAAPGQPPKRGPKGFTDEERLRAVTLVDAGLTITDVAAEYNVTRQTIWDWVRKRKRENADQDGIIRNLEKQILVLSGGSSISEAAARKIALLTNALNRQKRAREDDAKKKKPRVVIGDSESALELRARAASEIGLFGYQRQFFESDAQFRIVLKARQIGFSFVAGLEALVAAVAGRDQLFLSASEEQAVILTRYVKRHADTLGIVIDGGDKEIKLPGGAVIKAMAHNWRTVQGFTGDIWLDEFAWYANPKRIWAAFVPSIGTIKGRLTIMSTPFEAAGLFHDLIHDERRYPMFERYRITIHDAMADGLDFDLETMRALFDDDTWALMYECQFADDDAAFYPISLIKSCVHYGHALYTPKPSSSLFAGYDVGRVKDVSVLTALEPDMDRFRLAVMDVFPRSSFADQGSAIDAFMRGWRHARLRIDKTGIGMNLAENAAKKWRGRVTGVYFTSVQKEAMALNFRKLLEDKRLVLPNDPILIADIHSIKRRAGQKSFLYDSDRNEHGHADRFWSLALAASHGPILAQAGMGVTPGGKAWVC